MKAAPIYTCEVCGESSAWHFLGGFYQRVRAAQDYALKLEIDLNKATNSAQETQFAINQVEAALAIAWNRVEEKHREYLAAEEALKLERASHQETFNLLSRVLKEAEANSRILELLHNRIVNLEVASRSSIRAPDTSQGEAREVRMTRFTGASQHMVSKTAKVSVTPKPNRRSKTAEKSSTTASTDGTVILGEGVTPRNTLPNKSES